MTGLTVFLTGLPGAGKSTVAAHLACRLQMDGKAVSLLDSDGVRPILSPELGFSREERALHLRRLGFVAAEVTRHGGTAVCAAVAPHAVSRAALRRLVQRLGRFVLIYISTPVAVCEMRDPKGLYRRARSGEVQSFTGISDPYEPPTDAELVIDTTSVRVDVVVDQILEYLDAAVWSLASPVATEADRPNDFYSNDAKSVCGSA